MKTIRLFSGILVLSVILFSCSKSNDNNPDQNSNSAEPSANEVWIQGSTFNPATITVAPGTRVTWVNKDGMTHTVTSDATLFDSGNLGSNATYGFVFTSAGTYPYHCKIHTGMTGTVVVK